MTLYALVIQPFAELGFMRRALVGAVALALSCGPVGVFLVLRRMSLMGDALAHAVLPGAAVGYLVAGLSIAAMGSGGFVAGLVVVLLAGLVTRATDLREDASLAATFLISLALGVMIVTVRGSPVDLMHVLFGSILAVDDGALLLVAAITSLTLIVLATFYRPLVAECFDPGFLAALGVNGGLYHLGFLTVVVLNLVAGFQSMGTLMALGLLLLPAAAATFWVEEIWAMSAVATLIGIVAGVFGLLLSYHVNLPSGPAIVLSAGAIYVISVLFGRRGSLRRRLVPLAHRAA
jgi:zinc/manganese transport system permease protein